MLFAFVGNILPCYKNYFMYVNSLMSLSLFTKPQTLKCGYDLLVLEVYVTDVQSFLPSIRNANVHKLHVNRKTSGTDYNYSVNLPTL